MLPTRGEYVNSQRQNIYLMNTIDSLRQTIKQQDTEIQRLRNLMEEMNETLHDLALGEYGYVDQALIELYDRAVAAFRQDV